jgi:hypothetical protein
MLHAVSKIFNKNSIAYRNYMDIIIRITSKNVLQHAEET